MKVVLKGADFSANNIGQVEVPIIWETEAAAYIAAIPTAAAAFDYAKNRAINTFFKGLKDNSLLAKITKAYLPIFGQSEGAVNLINPSDTPLNLPSSNATYDSRGVHLALAFLANFSMDFTPCHFGFANLDGRPSGDGDVASYGICKNSGQAFLGRRCKSPNLAGISVTGSEYATVSNRSFSSGYVLGGTNGSVWQAIVDDEYVAPTSFVNDMGTANPVIGGSTVGSATGYAHHPLSYLTFGSGIGMTQSEYTIYGALIKALMAAFDE